MGANDAALLSRLLGPGERGDSEALARQLLARWPSLGEVMVAPAETLERIVGQAAAIRIADVRTLFARVTRDAIEDRPLIGDGAALETYLKVVMAYQPVEEIRILFLTATNRLLSDEVMGRGAADRIYFFPREVIRRALELRASGLILAHNHPGGDPEPSRADIQATHSIAQLAKVFDIEVHDHVVVTRERCISLRALGHL